MEDDSMFNTSPNDMDNFLNDIWSNADFEPPCADGSHTTVSGENIPVKEETLADVSKLCTQVAQRTGGGTSCENFGAKKETAVVRKGSKLSVSDPSRENLAMKQERVEHEAVDSICENFAMKEEIFTEFCTMVSGWGANQSASCLSRGNFAMKEDIVAQGSNLLSMWRRRRENAGGPSQCVDRAETRRRRMIKNRAAAARSRARNVVRLVNLELEVKRYKEENAMLRQKKQRAWEPENEKPQPRADRKLRRCKSCRW